MLNDISSEARIFLWGEGVGAERPILSFGPLKEPPGEGTLVGFWGGAPTAGDENFFNLCKENSWKPLRNLIYGKTLSLTTGSRIIIGFL